MKFPFIKLKSKSGQHTVEYVVLMTLVMAGIIISTPYVIRSWNANLKGWDDSITDSINDPLLQSPPTGTVPTFCYCNPSEPIGCGLGVATPLGFVQCASTEMLYYSACSPIDCEYSAYPGNVRATCSAAAGCCTAWADDVCGVNAIPHGDQPDGSCQDGYRLQTRTCGASAVLEYQCVVDTACNYICRDVLPTGVEYAGLCPGDDTQLPSNTWYSTVANGNCSTPAGSAPKCQIECAPTFFANGTACECAAQVDGSRILAYSSTEPCTTRAHPGAEFYQRSKIVNYSIQAGQCVGGCTEIEYRARINDMSACGGGPGPIRSWKGLDPMAANYSWQLQYYDHGWFTRSGSGFKPAGVTTINLGVRTHQGSNESRNWMRLTDCGLPTYQWAWAYCDGSSSCSVCTYNLPWNGTCPTCDASSVGQSCAIHIQGTGDDDHVYTCKITNQTICTPSNPPTMISACSASPDVTSPVCP